MKYTYDQCGTTTVAVPMHAARACVFSTMLDIPLGEHLTAAATAAHTVMDAD